MQSICEYKANDVVKIEFSSNCVNVKVNNAKESTYCSFIPDFYPCIFTMYSRMRFKVGTADVVTRNVSEGEKYSKTIEPLVRHVPTRVYSLDSLTKHNFIAIGSKVRTSSGIVGEVTDHKTILTNVVELSTAHRDGTNDTVHPESHKGGTS